jgi:hypothetical protein
MTLETESFMMRFTLLQFHNPWKDAVPNLCCVKYNMHEVPDFL